MPEQNPETQREFSVEKSKNFDKEEKIKNFDEEEKEPERVKFGRPQLGHFQLDHTGPFEPLLLSEDGEVPLIQVII